MSAEHFLWRDAWLLAAAAPLVVLWLLVWFRRARRGAALPYSSLVPFASLAPRGGHRRLAVALRCASVALLLLALARPQSGRDLSEVSSQGIDIVIAIDTSNSMMALDLDADRPVPQRRNRLEVARDVVDAFIAARASDQIGLVAFGEMAYTQCPLTLDHGLVRELLAGVRIGVAGGYTAVGDGLAMAVKRLQGSRAESKVVILLTDGRNNTGAIAPLEAAEAARALGVKVYAIGAGSRGGTAPFLVSGEHGARVVHRRVDLDIVTLEQIARLTGGASFLAEDAEALAQIYERIDALEKTAIEERLHFDGEEHYAGLLVAALALLLGEAVWTRTRGRVLP